MQDQKECTYYRKNVYGNTLMYPVNMPAVALCQIHGQKTVSETLIDISTDRLGFTWREVLESEAV